MFSEPVQYLPKPLYHLFTMMSAYRDTMDKDIKIEVAGDLEEAKHTNLNEIVSTLGGFRTRRFYIVYIYANERTKIYYEDVFK